MEINQNADFRHCMEIQKFSKTDTTKPERKSRSRFLSIIQGKQNEIQEDLHIGECVHNSYEVNSMMKEIRIADAYNDKLNSKHKYIEHLGGNIGPWFTSNNSIHHTHDQITNKNQETIDEMSSNELHLEYNDCGNKLDNTENKNQVVSLHDTCDNQYKYHRRRDFSQDDSGDSINPCSSTTADQRQNINYQMDFENAERTRTKPVLIMSRLTESWGSKRTHRAQTTKSAPGAVSSTSSRRSSDSGVSLWSRLAGSLHRHQTTTRTCARTDTIQSESLKKEESAPSSPATTRVMAFVPPIDTPPESKNSVSSRKSNKRKLAPPEPAVAITRPMRKTNFNGACKGKAIWAYSKRVQEELKSNCQDNCNSLIRPSNEDSEKWWAQPRDLQVDSQILRARSKEISSQSEKCFEIQNADEKLRQSRGHPIVIQHKAGCQEMVEEYIEGSESEVDINLTDNEDYNKCSCFRILTESVVQLFLSKPLRRRNR